MKARPVPAAIRRRFLSAPAPARSTPVTTARRRSRYLRAIGIAIGLYATSGAGSMKAATTADEDAKAVAVLDTTFQRAVKLNDAAAIERILDDRMVLVTGRGKVFTAAEHVEAAKNRDRTYAQQDEVEGTQTVRVHGDTAIVTALLWIKGTDKEGKAFDYKVWFSDTYVRKPAGWKYVFGQASLPLPKEGA